MNTRNVAIKIERIPLGTKMAVEVEGGWIRQTTDEEGVVVEDGGGHSIFIPDTLLATVVKPKKRTGPVKVEETVKKVDSE